MQVNKNASTTAMIGRGVLAGIAGTVAMTAFQKCATRAALTAELVEMPVTGRGDSYAPANFAQQVLPVHPTTAAGRDRLNYVTHFALGGMWGTAYGIAASAGLRGQQAVNAVFAAVYTGDLVLNTALGLYHPAQWSAQDWAIDVVDKYVQAQATGLVFDRVLDPAR